MSQYIIRLSVVLSLLGLILSVFLFIPQRAYAGGIVTNCADDADLHAKLAGGGEVTFACGSTPIVINLTITDTLLNHINITQTTTISGGGLITLQGDGLSRLFTIDASTLALNGMTLRNGRAIDPSNPGGPLITNQGGALQIINSSVVTITASTLADNRAGNVGGAINSENSFLTIQDSNLFNNFANFGGALFTLGAAGKATIINSAITSNTVNDKGGGIRAFESDLTIVNSTFSNNQTLGIDTGNDPTGAGAALAIYKSTAIITESTLENNQSYFLGGAIHADFSDLTIQNSSLVNNQAEFGGAIFNSNAGFGIKTRLINSAILSNTANGGDGGAIRGVDSDLIIANSTLSNNRAIEVAGSGGEGGAFGFSHNIGFNTIFITNTTIYSNFASVQGGGIQADTSYGSGTIKNSIVANNTAPSAANCGGEPLTSIGHNIDSGSGCSFGESSDLANTDPLLGPLADNGGTTLTHAPLAGSPVINAANNAACAADPVNNVDQRGLSRPLGAACDMGAVEATPSLTLIKSSLNQAGNPVKPGERITYTIFITNTGSLTATGGMISDNLPANTSFVAGSLVLNPAGAGTVGTTPPTLASGLVITPNQSVSVSYAVTVTSPLPDQTQIVNTASMVSNEVSSPLTSTVTDTVTSAPILSLKKTSLDANGDLLKPGDTLTYTIFITNTGSLTATGGIISDNLPANTSFVAGSLVLNPAGAGTVGTTPPTLASGLVITPNQSVSVSYAVKVNLSSPDQTQIVNTASMVSNEVSSPLTSTVTDTVANAALSLKKSSLDANGGLLEPGDTLTYTIFITNSGSITATGGVISDSVPANTSFVSGSLVLNPAGAGTVGTTPPTLASGLTLIPGQVISLIYAVTVSLAVADQTIITNTVALSSNEIPGPVVDVVTNKVTSKLVTYLPVIQKNFVP